MLLLWLIPFVLFLIGILGPWRDPPEMKTNGRLSRPMRMTLSFSLVIAALASWLGATHTPYAQWVAFGMLASFLGDVILARLIALPSPLIGGMIAFGIAHALYITAFVSTLAQSFDSAVVGMVVGLLFYCSFTIFAWRFWIRNPQKGAVINLGALVYAMIVGTMAAFAFALALARGGGFWLMAIGGLLFVASDLLIGVTDIRGIQIKNANDWIWLTYVGAQMGIVYGGGL